MARCKSTYPGDVTLRGEPVRCELAADHDGKHGHSFAARYWDDSPLHGEHCYAGGILVCGWPEEHPTMTYADTVVQDRKYGGSIAHSPDY